MSNGLPDPSDPPRQVYRLKPKAFERVNPGESAAPDMRPDPGVTSTSSDRIDVRDWFRQAAPGDNAAERRIQPADAENDVHALLRENRRHADAAGLNQLAEQPRRSSRRRRDYIVALLLGNLVLAGCTILSPIFGAAGLIIYNIGLTWIVWVVMDRY